MTLLILRWLHLMFMGSWFGVALLVPGDVRRTLEAPDHNRDLLIGRVKRAGMVGGVMGLCTFLTGVGLIFAAGGFGAVPVPVHIGLTLTLVMVGVGGLIRRTAGGLSSASADELKSVRGRMAMLSGVFQLLWVITLTLMVFRHSLM